MKIAFLAGTLGRGGAERQLIYMLRALKTAGIETRVLCLTKEEALENEIIDMGIDVDWVGDSENKVVRLAKITKNIRENSVDILQSGHFFTNFYAAAAGRFSGTRSIGAIRNDLRSEIKANHIYGKWQLKLPETLIANSQLAVDRAIENGIDPENINLVHNVVGEEVGKNGSAPNNAVTRVLFAGRLVPQKRPELFIELAAQLRRALPYMRLEFAIAGDGPLFSSLEQLARERNLQKTELRFLGEVSDMSSLYSSSDLLVLTSGHEGTPNVVLEAMAHGLPLVATKVGGLPELVNDKCGVLVDAEDFASLVNATKQLIDDQTLRRELGQEGQKYVRKNHSIEYLQKRLRDIYSTVLKSSDNEDSRKGK